LYGIPPEFYTADPGGINPWSSEVEIGYGESPTHLVRIEADSLEADRLQDSVDNYWRVSIQLRQV
jgi:hypothetical protein